MKSPGPKLSPSLNSPTPSLSARTLPAGLDSDEENFLDTPKKFGEKKSAEADDGIKIGSFYKKNHSTLLQKTKNENQLRTEINERLQSFKKSKKKSTKPKKLFPTKLVKKRSLKMDQKSQNEVILLIHTDFNSEAPQCTSKRKFFSARSPSKRPRSTMTIGNKKVQFEAVRKRHKEPKIPISTSPSQENECEMFSFPVQIENPVSDALPIETKNENVLNKETATDDSGLEKSIEYHENIFGELGNEVEIAPETKESKEENEIIEASPRSKQLYPVFLYRRNLNQMQTSTQEKKPKKTRTKRFKQSKNDKMEQLVIDAGQKEVVPNQCKECGMWYTPCDDVDDGTHNAFHNKRLKRLNLSGWKSERVLQSFSDGRIILVLPTDPHFMLQKLQDVWEEINVDMGDAMMKTTYDLKYYIFVSNEKKIIGFMAAEPQSEAFPLTSDKNEPATDCDPAPVRVVCGIFRLWTLASNRKEKIATRLMNCLRRNFVYGYVMARSDLAFCSPTQDGIKFFTRYTGTESFLVYK